MGFSGKLILYRSRWCHNFNFSGWCEKTTYHRVVLGCVYLQIYFIASTCVATVFLAHTVSGLRDRRVVPPSPVLRVRVVVEHFHFLLNVKSPKI